jgi:hypothetical protein
MKSREPRRDYSPDSVGLGTLRTERRNLLLLFLGGSIFVAILHWRLLLPSPIAYADLTYLSVQSGVGYQLSQPYPATYVATHYAFELIGPHFGSLTNFLGVFSYALLPPAVYPFLRMLRNSRGVSFVGAVLYLANPIVLFFSPIYISWSLVLISIPIAAALLLEYNQSGKRRYLLYLATLLATLTIVDPVLGGLDSLRSVIPAVGLLAVGGFLFGTPQPRRRMAIDYAVAAVLFCAVALPAALVFSGQYSFFLQQSQSSGTDFYNFHLSNVIYTYQGQNLFASLSGVISYPGNPQSLIGYENTLSYPLWILIVVSTYTLPTLSRRGVNQWYLLLLLTSAAASGSEFAIQAGLVTPLFSSLPVLFLYEYPESLSIIIVFTVVCTFTCVLTAVARYLRFFFGSDASARVRQVRFRNLEYSILVRPSSRARTNAGLRPHTGLRRRLAFAAGIIFCAGILLIAPGLPAEVGYAAGAAALPPSPSDAVPDYYFQLPSKLIEPPTDYRILPLPLTYTSYIDLRTVVPTVNLFGIPYAGVNTIAGLYPGYANLLTVLRLISTNSTIALSSALVESNVKFLLITDISSTAPLSLSETGYSAYLDGGGGTFLAELLAAPGLILDYSTASYAILSVANYTSPVEGVQHLIALSSSNETATEQAYPLGANSGFRAGGTAWGQWSSCPGLQSQWIAYTSQGANLTACPGTSSTVPAQTEVYQRVPLLPFQNVMLSVNVSSDSNMTASLIVIFHNGTNSASFYSTEQFFPAVPNGPNMNVSRSVTSPAGTTYAWLGFQVLNYRPSVGSTLLRYFGMFAVHNQTSGEVHADPEMVPYLSSESSIINSSSVPSDLTSDVERASWITPPADLNFTAPQNWSWDQINDTLFLRNETVNADLTCVAGRSITVFGLVWGILGHNELSLGASTLAPAPGVAEWQEIEVVCPQTTDAVTLSVVMNGTLAITDLGILIGAQSGASADITQRLSQGTVIIGGNGEIALATRESVTVTPGPTTSDVEILSIEGSSLIVANLSSPGELTLSFPHFVYKNSELIDLNVSSFLIDGMAIAFCSVAILRPQALIRVQRGLGSLLLRRKSR